MVFYLIERVLSFAREKRSKVHCGDILLHSGNCAAIIYWLGAIVILGRETFISPVDCYITYGGNNVPKSTVDAVCFANNTFIEFDGQKRIIDYYTNIAIFLFFSGMYMLLPGIAWTYFENRQVEKAFNNEGIFFILF